MRYISKALLFMVAAAALLGLGATTASASRGVTIPGGAITATGGSIVFSGSVANITCRVTLTGTLNTSITKTAGASVGSVTGGSTTGCSSSLGGTATATVLEFPWPIRYNSFTGTLPNISSVLMTVGPAGFLILVDSIFGRIACLFRGSFGINSSGNPITTLTVQANQTAALVSRLALATIDCPRSGSLTGSFTLSPTQRMTLF
jgi:hypothetical protein